MVPDPGSLALVLGMVGRSDANGNGRCCSDGRMRFHARMSVQEICFKRLSWSKA
jgi:hypothetical protein